MASGSERVGQTFLSVISYRRVRQAGKPVLLVDLDAEAIGALEER